MTNKTIAMWITITGILTLVSTTLSWDDSLVGAFVIAFIIFAFIGAFRLNKLN